jgi:hypothetical protein
MHGTRRHTAVPLAELPVGACHWPVSTNSNNEHMFCAAPIAYSENRSACNSYCGAHAARAFVHLQPIRGVPRAARVASTPAAVVLDPDFV